MTFDRSKVGHVLTWDQKLYHQSRDLVESNPLLFSAKLYDAPFSNARGGRTNPPCMGEDGKTPFTGEG